MPTHINSAYRVHAILFAACENHETNEKMWEVFGDVFRIHINNGRKKIFEINRMLDLFYDEIENTRRQMEASNFSPDLYEDAFKIIEERITPGLIYNDWHSYRKTIESILRTLKFCSEVIPNEEELVNQEDLNSIEQLLQKLEEKLKDSDLPDQVTSFIRHQISLIRKAMRDYQVVGIKAFKTAFYEGYADCLINEEVILGNEDKEEISLLMKAWNGVKKAGEITIKAEKLLTAGSKIYELGEKFIDHIHKMN